MRRALIFGGQGQDGAIITNYLIKKKYKVTSTSRNKKKKIINLSKNLIYKKCDISESKKVFKIIKNFKPDEIYNFAAISDIGYAKYRPIETAKINILGTLNALTLSKKYNVKKFIQASTIYATSEEGGFYARSKKAAEDYIEEFKNIYGLNYTILRFGSLYGERSNNNNGVRNIIDKAIKKKELIYRGKKNAARRYIHVEDAAKACVIIMNKKYNNKYITITGNKLIRINKIFNILSDYFTISKKKMKYLNEKYTGHYHTRPTRFKQRIGQNLVIKEQKDFTENLLKLADEIEGLN